MGLCRAIGWLRARPHTHTHLHVALRPGQPPLPGIRSELRCLSLGCTQPHLHPSPYGMVYRYIFVHRELMRWFRRRPGATAQPHQQPCGLLRLSLCSLRCHLAEPCWDTGNASLCLLLRPHSPAGPGKGIGILSQRAECVIPALCSEPLASYPSTVGTVGPVSRCSRGWRAEGRGVFSTSIPLFLILFSSVRRKCLTYLNEGASPSIRSFTIPATSFICPPAPCRKQ